MKNIIYKLLKTNSKFYDSILNQIIEDNKTELIEKLVGNKKVFSNNEITELEGVINDSILVNCVIKDSNIKRITNNIMEKCIISNNYSVPESFAESKIK